MATVSNGSIEGIVYKGKHYRDNFPLPSLTFILYGKMSNRKSVYEMKGHSIHTVLIDTGNLNR